MKVFVIYDEYSFFIKGVVEADSEVEAKRVADTELYTPFKHDYKALEVPMILKEDREERNEVH